MSKTFGVIGLLAGLLLLAAVSYHLWLQRQAAAVEPTADRYLENMISINELQKLSAVWGKEILQVKATPFADFDAVAQIIPQVRKLRYELNNSELTQKGSPASVKNLLLGYLNLSEAQEESLERFKSGFAIVRNSVKYLPVAERRVIANAKDAKKEKVIAQVGVLTNEILTFAANPEQIAQQKASKRLDQLEKAATSLPDGLRNAIDNFTSHARVLLARSLPTEALLQRAIDAKEADETAQALLRSYTLWHQEKIDQRQAQAQIAKSHWTTSLPSVSAGLGASLLVLLGLYLLFARSQNAQQVEMETQVLQHIQAQGGKNAEAAGKMLASVHKRIGELAPAMTKEVKTLKETVQALLANPLQQSSQQKMPQTIDQLGQEVGRLNLVHYQLSDSLVSAEDRRNSDINALLDQAIDASIAYTTNITEIKRDYGNLPPAIGPDGGLRMAFIKVLKNSMQAIEMSGHSGIVEVSTHEEAGKIHIRFKDNGMGLNQGSGAEVLAPFYERLFAAHKGSAAVTTDHDTGTLVEVALTAATKRA